MKFTYISTDAVVSNTGGGWSFVEHSRKPGTKQSITFQEYGSVSMSVIGEAKLYAIYKALDFVKKSRHGDMAVINSDDFNAVLVARKGREGLPIDCAFNGWLSEDINRFKELLNDKSLAVNVRCVNRRSTDALEQADKLARKGSEEAQSDSPAYYKDVVMSLIETSTTFYRMARATKNLPEFSAWYEEATSLRLKALYYIEKMGSYGERFMDLLPTYKEPTGVPSTKTHVRNVAQTSSIDDLLVDDWPDTMPRPTEAVGGDIFTTILNVYEESDFGFSIR